MNGPLVQSNCLNSFSLMIQSIAWFVEYISMQTHYDFAQKTDNSIHIFKIFLLFYMLNLNSNRNLKARQIKSFSLTNNNKIRTKSSLGEEKRRLRSNITVGKSIVLKTILLFVIYMTL